VKVFEYVKVNEGRGREVTPTTMLAITMSYALITKLRNINVVV
jgi:hypothetical protein